MKNKSWKTTVLGCLASLTLLIQQTVNLLSVGQKVDWYKVGFAAFLAILAFFMKDSDVTGGTVTQPTVPNPPTLIEKK